ncbi:MAG: hypothetical protein ABIQ99_14840 [Thermoflexales bacterium]
MHRVSEQDRSVFTFRATHAIWLVFGLLEALIGFRIGMKLVGANHADPFAIFVYNTTSLFVAPFAGLATSPSVGMAVLELSSVIALVAYALIGWGVERIVWLFLDRPREIAAGGAQPMRSGR